MRLNFDDLHAYQQPAPPLNTYTLLGDIYDVAALPPNLLEQVAFFHEPAVADFLYQYITYAQLVTGPVWNPFAKGNFKQTENFTFQEDQPDLKKWLYQRGLPFSTWVYVLPNYLNVPLTMTWKAVIKLEEELFAEDDLVLFDATGQWCMLYWHEGTIFHGAINHADPAEGYAEMERLLAHKKRFPKFKLPYH